MKTLKKIKERLPTILGLSFIGFIVFCVIVSVKNSNSAIKSNDNSALSDKKVDSLAAVYTNDPEEKQINEMTLAQKLVLIESGEDRSVNDPYVITVDNLLNELSEKYHEPKDTIADYTQKAQAVLKEDDVTIQAAKLMNEVNVSKRYKGTKYKDMISVYMMLYGKRE